MKIGVISLEFPPLTFGGVSIVAHNLATTLANRGHEVHVFCGKAKKTRKSVNPKISLHELPFFPFTYLDILTFSTYQSLLEWTSRHLQKLDLDVIHAHSPYVFPFLFLNKLDTPFIVTYHSSSVGILKSAWRLSLKMGPKDAFRYSLLFPFWFMIDKLESKYADHITCPAKFVKDDLVHFFGAPPHKVSVVPNATSIPEVKFDPNEERENCILYVGRLSVLKGVPTLIKAMPIVKRELPDAQLLLIGDGPLEGSLRKLAAETCRENIKFLGYVPYEQLSNYYRIAKIQVVPSLFESFSMVLLEGAVHKKCVLASDIEIFKEIIQDTSLYFRAGDPVDLANKIVYLLTNADVRKEAADSLNRLVVKNFDLEKVVVQLENLYKQVLEHV